MPAIFHRFRRAARHASLILAVTGILSVMAGCATQTVRVNGAWAPDATRAGPFERVMVVGVSPDLNARCSFEAFLAGRLSEGGTRAMTSCSLMEPKQPLTTEGVKKAVAAHDIDAVMATFLVTAKAQAKEGGTSETRGDAYYKATGWGYVDPYYYSWYGAYGVPVVYGEFQTADPITTVEGTVDIITMVYETTGAQLVYEMSTRATDLYSRVQGLAEATGPMAERLRRDGLVR